MIEEEVLNSRRNVFDLRERIIEMIKMANEDIAEKQNHNKQCYDV